MEGSVEMKKLVLGIAAVAVLMLTGSIYFSPYDGKCVIIADSKTFQAKVKNQTVYEALKAAGITLEAMDIVSPSLNTRVSDGMNINIIRVRESLVKVRNVQSFGVRHMYDAKLNKDETVVLECGKPGYIEKQYKVLYHNEKEVWRKLYNIVSEQKPKDDLVVVGTGNPKRVYNMPKKKMWVVKTLTMHATGYYPGPEDCGVFAEGVTSSGLKAGYGVVAVDKKVIPFGTKLYIPTYGFAIAADEGSGIKDRDIDLCFETYKESSVYSPRYLKVYIIE